MTNLLQVISGTDDHYVLHAGRVGNCANNSSTWGVYAYITVEKCVVVGFFSTILHGGYKKEEICFQTSRGEKAKEIVWILEFWQTIGGKVY